MPDADGWDVNFDRAMTATVEVYNDGEAALILADEEGELGVWEFHDFPGDDFMNRGLNIIGPWLNRHGLAYQSWMEPNPGEHLAMVYTYNGPEVDPRIVARRRTQ